MQKAVPFIKNLVSVIIVNYNTENLLDNCIKSIKEKTKEIDFEIIVVDNKSTENSLNKLIEEHKDINFILSDKNWGFGVANNIGVKHARGEFLFFLNPDTILINNAILELHNYLINQPLVGICGGNLYKEDMSPCSSLYDIDFLHLEYQILLNKKRVPGFNYSNDPKFTNVIVGADFLIRRQIFDDLEGFDQDFFMYFEEVELCYRVHKNGYKIASVPKAKIIHLQGGSAENKNEELKKWSYSEHWYSKFLFFRKTKGSICSKWIYLLYTIKMKLAIAFYLFKSDTDKINYWDIKRKVINNAYKRYCNVEITK